MEKIGTVAMQNAPTANKTNKKQQTGVADEDFLAMLSGMLGLTTNPQEGSASHSLMNDGQEAVLNELFQSEPNDFLAQGINLLPQTAEQKLLALAGKGSALQQMPAAENGAEALFTPGNLTMPTTPQTDAQSLSLQTMETTEKGLNMADSRQNGIFPDQEMDLLAQDAEAEDVSTKLSQETLIQNGEQASLKMFGEPQNSQDGQNNEVHVDVQQMTNDFPELVISKLKTMNKADGTTELVVQLEPKELGKMVVTLTSDEGTVSVKITAHAPVTRDLLESGLNSLRQSFQDQGIRFDKLDIELGGEQFNQSNYEHQQQDKESWQQSRFIELKRAFYEPSHIFENDLRMAEQQNDRVLTGMYDYLV